MRKTAIPENTVRAMDTGQGRELAVSIEQDTGGRWHVIIADTTRLPGWSTWLTDEEAHKLGMFLTEQAAEADARNADDWDLTGD